MKTMINYALTAALFFCMTCDAAARSARIPKSNQIDLFKNLNPQTGKSYCPDYIFTKQELHATNDGTADAHIAALTETKSARRNNLETIDFYLGPARGQAQLKPEQYGKISRWEFLPAEGVHYVCRYNGTDVTLDAPLEASIAKCEVSPYNNKYGIEYQQVICTRRE
jgi:hypothetical protein